MESHKFPILISSSLTISLSIHNNNVGRLTMLPITVLSACLSIGLSAYLPHCPSVCLSVRLPSVFPPHNLHHTLSLSVHLHLTTSQSHNIHWSLDTHNSISFDYSHCQVQYSCVCVCVCALTSWLTLFNQSPCRYRWRCWQWWSKQRK